MPFLYRTAIILSRRQPYVDWANSLVKSDDEPRFPASLAEQKAIYLGPHSDTAQTLTQVLDQIWDAIFDEELDAWSTNEELWPDQTRAMFDQWFVTELAGSVVDLVPDDPLTETDMEDLDFEDALRHCAWCDTELDVEQGRDVRFEITDSTLLNHRLNRVLALAIERDRAAIGVVRRAETGADDGDGDLVVNESVESDAAPLEAVFRACSRPCEKRLLKTVPPALRALEQALANAVERDREP